jgi:hypothetical protein
VLPATQWLRNLKLMSGSTGAGVTANGRQKIILADLLMYYPFVDTDAVGSQQDMVNSVTLPRYDYGNVIAVGQSTSSTTGQFTFSYTNQNGVAGRTSQNHFTFAVSAGGQVVASSVGSSTSYHPYLSLQAGDYGVKSIEGVTFTAGGGGLMAGVALAVQTLSPRTRIVGVEPELYDDARRSLASGRRETAAPRVRTLCDSLETPSTGELTFPILRDRLSAIVTVSDAEVAGALRLAFSTLKLVVEPGGGVGLAALLAGKVPEATPGACVGLVLSGGNVDPDLFARVLRGEF